MTTLHLKKSIARSPWRLGFLLIPLALACFALAPLAEAAPPPKPEDRGNGNSAAENVSALNLATTGSNNTAHGWFSLFSNTTGGNNVATGYQALFSNTTGRRNVANGSTALFSNTAGNFNVAQGDQTLYSNTIGSVNTAIGFGALFSNMNCDDPGCTEGGSANTAIGAEALESLTTGGGNTAIGEGALINHMTGNQNIAVGLRAGQNLTDGGVNVYIANQGVPAENRTIRIGNVVSWTDIYGFGHPAHTATYIAGINGATASGGVAVYINSDGLLGTLTSSARFKQDITPMNRASEAILALKPVTFRYKKEIDPAGTSQFGLVAEDVEKVNPDLVVRDKEGKPYSVRYEQVNAMLLNEFLKEHHIVQEQQATITQLESTVAQQKKDFQATVAELTARLDEQASQIQKVSAQLEASKPAPRVVNNP
jgi:hypothetical protein